MCYNSNDWLIVKDDEMTITIVMYYDSENSSKINHDNDSFRKY